MSKIFKKILLVFVFLFHQITESSSVVVNVNRGVMKPVTVAVNISDPSGILHEKFLNVVNNNLQGTFLFRSIPEKAFMQQLTSVGAVPKFSLWKIINAQYLLNCEMRIDGERLYVESVLYDVVSESKVGIFSANGNMSEWRKMAHMISNNVYERITGEVGYFDTKILYVSVNKGAAGRKVYRLAIMDQDGYNHKILTSGNSVVLTPRFAPNGKEFSFFSYQERSVNGRLVPTSASVHRYNLATGNIELLARFKGMTYAPRYSPDGRFLIFSLSNKGSSSIYTMELSTKKITRLTKGLCIDTSPCYSPDGKYIVFNSDRGGTQQLYIMDSDGCNLRRLSFQKGRYATPVWSPRGDWIAFTKFGNGSFNIGIIRPDGSSERMLASGYLVEGPTWSPNGRVVMYSHQDYSKRERIHSVDITGYNQHEVATPSNAIDPEWSTKLNFSVD